jgi:hypothetical protein
MRSSASRDHSAAMTRSASSLVGRALSLDRRSLVLGSRAHYDALPGELFQRAPIAHRPTMTKGVGKTTLTMRAPRRIVPGYWFYIGRACLGSPFDEITRSVYEDLDPGRRRAQVGRARLGSARDFYRAQLRGGRTARHRDEAQQRRQDPTTGRRPTRLCTS